MPETRCMMSEDYYVEPPLIPADDLSGVVGDRLLALLRIQVRRNLACLARDRAEKGIEDEDVIVTSIPYCGSFLGGFAYALAVLARFGGPPSVEGELGPEQLEMTGAAIIRAWLQAYEADESQDVWRIFSSGRFLHLLGMSAWLLWERLAPETRLAVTRTLAVEADRFLADPAPAQLYDDTQAETNAWTGGGLATVSGLLRRHSHRALWEEKAREYMISAYATVGDVESGTVVDGKPLNEWLHGPNAFPDYTVENHGFVHPDYLAAVSEMVRSAIAYRLAGEVLPEAVTFNAVEVFDILSTLSLPDGSHLYVQGTDYTPHRVDSLFQACNIAILYPTPAREAWLLRCIAILEARAEACPDVPLSGWIGFPYDLGVTLGLTQNYMTCRLFGAGTGPLPDDRLEAALAGVHVSEPGCFAIARTSDAVSSFSWHARTDPPRVMGMTMPLDRDVLLYPEPWSLVGEVREADHDGGACDPVLNVFHSQASEVDHGFSVELELAWCSGKVRQQCAFTALADGRSVYIERRVAVHDLTIARAVSGTIAVLDDAQWPFQAGPRLYSCAEGAVTPDAGRIWASDWLNIGDRMGYIVLGGRGFRLSRVEGAPCIFRGAGTMYDTCRIEFVPTACAAVPASFAAGQQLSSIAVVACPNQPREETAELAQGLQRIGWSDDGDDAALLHAVSG